MKYIYMKGKNIKIEDINLNFLAEDHAESRPEIKGTYKILVADDDESVHTITNMILKSFVFEDRSLQIINTYSAEETMDVLKSTHDIAVLLLDVVMEEKDSGLKVVDYLRKELDNKTTRIVLRTGQPGQAPEEKVIIDYDINDYKLKTELTKQKLFTTMYSCLRSYRDIVAIEKNRQNLEKMIRASDDMLKQDSFEGFLNSVFEQLFIVFSEEADGLLLRENKNSSQNGIIFIEQESTFKIIAGTGVYSQYNNHELSTIESLKELNQKLQCINNEESNVIILDNGFVFFSKGRDGIRNYVYIETGRHEYNFELIQLFLRNYSLALDNYALSRMMLDTQHNIIMTLSEVIEKMSYETSYHIQRVSSLMFLMAQKCGFSKIECENLRLASKMHDVGKISIPDHILKKPDKLTAEEFNIIKNHTIVGYDILKKTDHATFRLAADIALYHHEKFSGEGYPHGLAGNDIPFAARIMAIIDVFDALISRRCYKEPYTMEDTINIIQGEKGRHFDPDLVDLFIDSLDEVKKIIVKFN